MALFGAKVKKVSFQDSSPRIRTYSLESDELYNRRQSVNEEILKKLRLRAGTENMISALGASKDKKRMQMLELELSFLDSDLQLLKEELAVLNCPIQYSGVADFVPLIPIGIKQTTDIGVKFAFKDFILEHYSEDGEKYESCIEDFLNLRRDVAEVAPVPEGINKLLEYYNQLFYIDYRFFPRDRNMNVFFQWYDSVSGFPSSELAVAFEQGAILFNIGACWSHIAVKQDKRTLKGCREASEAFQQAAGAFQYLRNNYFDSPSLDMCSEALDLFLSFMLAQGQECVFEGEFLERKDSLESYSQLGLEASEVVDAYEVVTASLKEEKLQAYIPTSWNTLAMVKLSYYRALSNFYTAKCINDLGGKDVDQLEKNLARMYIVHSDTGTTGDICMLIAKASGRKRLAKSHLRVAMGFLEESLRKFKACPMLRKNDVLPKIICDTHEKVIVLLAECEEDDEFVELSAPIIKGGSKMRVTPIPPQFDSVNTTDIFKSLITHTTEDLQASTD